ncbi:MAG TPA: M50 family metallopeptidase [Thermoanaerobaculia bacterium]|jgi:Zn-dependent protease|nr:M50 family metallopeptidase [Thermoanaerobaculia bacterium]
MLRLGTIGRTPIDIDFSFFILIGLFVALNYDQRLGIQYALIWIPILFLSVLIHELAHAGAIAGLGFGASHIVLGGMGGVTINQRRAKAWQDFIISVAGPASSFLLAFLCRQLENTQIGQTDRMLQVLFPLMVSANIFWGLFNLVPVPPLDGGHATREFFRMFLSERTAFVISIWIAIIVGAGVVVLAFMARWFFLALYIAWFVYLAFQQWQYFREHGVPGD